MAKQKEYHKQESEVEEKVLYVNRCAKVVKGGRKFSFSALVLVAAKGKVGYGFAKANELADAIKKGGEAAKKNMIEVTLEGTTIPYEMSVKWDGAHILFKPAKRGTGVIAGSKVRPILEFAGFEDVMAKSLGSNNPLNLVHATFKALKSFKSREEIKKMRGKS